MENEFYLELITRYLDGSASQEEAEALLNWLKADKQNMELFIEAKDIWLKSSILYKQDTETEFALLRFKQKLTNNYLNKQKTVFWNFKSVAAIIIIAFLTGALALSIIKNYQSGTEIVFNETIIPNGQKGKVILSDGTKIVLNSGSRLKYPSNFSLGKREVYLEGEAYFDVAHNESTPFFVHSGKIAVKVLGTSFNMKSYPEENKIETTLITGSVKILKTNNNKSSEISTLEPNEQAVYYKSSGKISIKRLDQSNTENKELSNNKPSVSSIHATEISPRVESVILWKDQKLIFENETLEQMAQKLTRWYGKNVHIESESLKNNRYSGKFIYNETIYEVLDVISLTTDLKYYEKAHEIFIIQSK